MTTAQTTRRFWQEKRSLRQRPIGLTEPDLARKVCIEVSPDEKDRTKYCGWKTYTLCIALTIVGILVFRNNTPYSNVFIPHSNEVRYTSAVVAADSEICSKIGRDILLIQKGSAADAAVAAALCTGAVNLHSMGLGGGFVATVYNKNTGQVSSLDARESAPNSAHRDMFKHDAASSLIGAKSIAVPGELKGYWSLHQKFGKLPWADLFEPTIDLCENGFRIGDALGRAIQVIQLKGRLEHGLREILTNQTTGNIYKSGELLKLPKLGETLRQIALEGAETFYTGSLSKYVLSEIQLKDGILSTKDLKEYQAIWRTPIQTTLSNGQTVYAPPSPCGGPVLLQALNILDGYQFNGLAIYSFNYTIRTLHRFAEAFKFASVARAELGDPDFIDVKKTEEKMLSRSYAEELRQRISDDRTFDSTYYGWTPHDQVKEGTSHLSVLDEEGNAVSLTSSINQYGGSSVVGENTGIIYNCAMNDFSIPGVLNHFEIKPTPNNYIVPGKRPLTSMAPTMILNGDGSLKMVIGAAGGSRIPTTLAQIIIRVLHMGQNLSIATDALRIHHQLHPQELFIESRARESIRAALEAKGHVVTSIQTRGSVVQSILINGDEIIAIADDRKGGMVAGY